MKIALAQQNYHIGNFEANTQKIIEGIAGKELPVGFPDIGNCLLKIIRVQLEKEILVARIQWHENNRLDRYAQRLLVMVGNHSYDLPLFVPVLQHRPDGLFWRGVTEVTDGFFIEHN